MIDEVLVNDKNIDLYRDYMVDCYRKGEETTIDGYLFKIVEQYGGEGMGENYWIVFSVEKDGKIKYYRINGWYASYYGRDIDPTNYYEVKQVEKTITVWE